MGGLDPGHGRQQRHRVGVFRRAHDTLGGAHLDDAALVHDGDPVGEMSDDRDVVRDEEIGNAEAIPEVGKQVDDRSLHRYVERRHRLVADDEARPVASARAMPTRCFSPPLI